MKEEFKRIRGSDFTLLETVCSMHRNAFISTERPSHHVSMVAVTGLPSSLFTAASRLSGRQQSSNMCVVCVVARSTRRITAAATTVTPVAHLAMRCASVSTTATYQVTPLAAVPRHMHTRMRGFAAEAADEVEGEVVDQVEKREEAEYLCRPV